MEEIMLLMHTDLPEPVAPATSRWGMEARSPITVRPYTSLPRASGIFFLGEQNSGSWSSSRSGTATFLRLTISMPTVSLPGMGATMFTLSALVASAMSLEYWSNVFTRTPRAGYTSYRVMVGPRVMSPGVTSTRNVVSVSMIFCWISSISSRSASVGPSGFSS